MKTTYKTDEVDIHMNGAYLEKGLEVVIDGASEAGSPCSCGQPSEYGGHGIRDGKVYDEYYCQKCYNMKKRETS